MKWTRAVVGALFAISTASAAFAQAPPAAQGAGPQGAGGGQGRGRGEPPPPYRPAKDAKDLKSVLFNWTWYLGMLRGVDEHELIVSLEHQAKTGTVQVDGQPCAITKFRASTNYQLPGQRTQYTCTRANGQAHVQVTDEGPGVPSGDIARIFDKFYRSPSVTATTGAGLGLSIARGFMEAMGGAVTAANRPEPQRGLAVTLKLGLASEMSARQISAE